MKKKPDTVSHGRAMERGARDKTPAKVLHHIEIHPNLGGGVRIEHHHTNSLEHPVEVHEFEPKEGPLAHSHLEKHAGMAMAAGEEKEAGKEMAKERKSELAADGDEL